MTRVALLAIVAGAMAACAANVPPRPAGTAAPDPTAAPAFVTATRHCRPLRTGTAEIALSGHAGRERVRGRLLAGFAAPASLRLEVLAPFGAPALVLASDGASTTLVFPRDRQVLHGADVSDVLEATTGLGLGADDLRRILFGCLATEGEATGSRIGDWQVVDVDGTRVYLRRAKVVAADYRGWRIDYLAGANGLPQNVRVRRDDPAGVVDLTAVLSQIELNVDLSAETFSVSVPAGATPITLDDLRANSPLAARAPGH